MAWQTPKTDWQTADIVQLDDMNRIEGNIQELQDTKETPADAQAKVDTHANLTNAHSATSAATANRIIIRDSAGRAKVTAPNASDDIARKAEVDTVQADLDTHKADNAAHNATSAATANRIIVRDAYGRAKVAAPAASDDIARKAEVDAKVTGPASAVNEEIVVFDGTTGKQVKGSNVKMSCNISTCASVTIP